MQVTMATGDCVVKLGVDPLCLQTKKPSRSEESSW